MALGLGFGLDILRVQVMVLVSTKALYFWSQFHEKLRLRRSAFGHTSPSAALFAKTSPRAIIFWSKFHFLRPILAVSDDHILAN